MASPSAQLTTQRERGIGHGKVVKQVVERFPFVAGMVHFAYQNLADSEGQGWGLVDNEGRPYRDFVSASSPPTGGWTVIFPTSEACCGIISARSPKRAGAGETPPPPYFF